MTTEKHEEEDEDVSDRISIRLTNETELCRWIKQNINNINQWTISLYKEAIKQQQTENKQNNMKDMFQQLMFLFLGINFLLFAIIPFYDITSIITSSLLIFSSILLFIYIGISYKTQKNGRI